ncbi:hypothetical protein LX81_02719 [Palleronia aestuarii]|uniref:Uncharacterized protein n=1 Tax=Palleronia aestuarii TaxID=568105 RepID=A0A2W7N463_9RHOB|nr:hypothetical protein LX81_02719 [Palleronia aestuarii]
MARSASFLLVAPGLSFFNGLALRRGGTTASAPRGAMASRQVSWRGATGSSPLANGVVGTVGGNGCDWFVHRDLAKQVGQ